MQKSAPIHVQSTIHGSTAAGSPAVNDTASQLQGARPIPVPSILAGQDTSPSISTSDYIPDLQGAQVQQPVSRLPLPKETSLFGEKEKTRIVNSPKPRSDQTYRYLLDAARSFRPSCWKQSFALIVGHMPGAYEYEKFSSLRGQPSSGRKQTLTVKQADAIAEAMAASGNEALLPPEFNQDMDRLVKGYLQWRKEQSAITEPVSVSCCMQLLKSLQRGGCSSSPVDDDNDMYEYLAHIVSDKDTALSEAAKLEQQTPRIALFMYQLIERINPGASDVLGVDNEVLHKQPEVCALLAATLLERVDIAEALTKNGSAIAQLQQQLWETDVYRLQGMLPGLLPLLRHDQAWTTDHFPLLKEMNGSSLQHLLPLLQHDQAWTTQHLPHLKKMMGLQLHHLLPLLQHNQTWTTRHLPHLEVMSEDQLQYLFPLLQHDQAWTTRHLPLLKEMNGYQLQHLLPLLQHDDAWTNRHLHLLKKMEVFAMEHLLPLLQHDQAWTTQHFPLFKEMSGNQLQHILPLLQHDQAWTTQHFHRLEEMKGFQLQHLLPLLRHDQKWTTKRLLFLKKMKEPHQLQHLLPLLQHDQAWTTQHFPLLKGMSGNQLQHILPLLQHDQAWTTQHFPLLKGMSGNQLQHILPLLQHDQACTTQHLPLLNEMYEDQLQHILPLLQHDQAWTTQHFPLLKGMSGNQLQYLFPLLQHDQAWTTEHFPLLKGMSGNQLQYLFPLLQHDQAWTTEHLHDLQNRTEDELLSLSRYAFFIGMNISPAGFLSAANPYVRDALSPQNQDMEELTKVLKTHGASRSTFHPERTIASYLTEKFKHNYQQIPGATFGVENEMFIPGIPESNPSEIEDELNDRLGIKDKKYRYVTDGSLSTDAPFATPPIEQVTSILHAPEDIQRLQSALSILNDWRAFTNHTAGVHIHTGIKQWKAANCLNTPEEKSRNRFLPQWDRNLSVPRSEITITPYQLLFMKQFLVNMVAMQKDFYLVSRKSEYSEPNGPISGNDLDKYYQDVSRTRDYEELLSSANTNERYFNVNLKAYEKHGTIEVRGFTKKNSDNMEVDPNLPVRDLIFMQDVLIKVLHDTKHILLSDASPDDPIEVRPSAGLTEIVKEYVQDVFLLEIIHALGQRDPAQRVKTMEAIVNDKDFIASETLQKIRESQVALLEGDPLAEHFLNALNSDMEWNPSFVERTPLKRIHSLRNMADAGFSGMVHFQ